MVVAAVWDVVAGATMGIVFLQSVLKLINISLLGAKNRGYIVDGRVMLIAEYIFHEKAIVNKVEI